MNCIEHPQKRTGLTHMSAKEFREMLQKENLKKPRKHRNIIVYVCFDGFVCTDKDLTDRHGGVAERYDSEKEYQRWHELRLLQKSGKIRDLERQTCFVVYDAFVDGAGKKHRESVYRADFTYTDSTSGIHVVEDVKGQDRLTGKFLTTPLFELKWKILQSKYPDYSFRLY